ncbi:MULTISPECIES: ATP-dependent endonuclease [unclassified Burkholderia]|uniref:ATP-dependent nuclease n=1 Tax=unclassified Burkholderia TaxID=2613784 RepID=UPI00075D2F4F|nr:MULTISPECIES: ATP-dependent endonuclease [unclassified Burkholderia]KVN17515.1 ATP-dependent endonuclease [Burkholderia sp. MSMB1552]KWZ51885.1 ATP-dependent endonuclease [Burkholderia sp. MSMB1588]
MKIQSVRIRNFRTLKDVTIPFDSVTTFIGPNGAGKSTVLRALDWYFNGKPSSLTEKDCSFGATAEDIEVQVTFADLTNKDRDALGKYAPDGVATFTAWKRRLPDGSDVLSANAKGFPDFNTIKAASGATAKKDLYAELRRSRADLNLPAANTGAAVEQAMMAWEASHIDQLVDAPEALQTNFFGFNSGGKMSGLFDFVLVTADLRASDESIDGKSSIIGRILERSIDRAAADEEIAKIVDESRAKQQIVYEEKFKAQLETITTQLNDVVKSYSPGRAVTVSPAGVELKAPRTTFEVAVLDGTTETAVERQGHGFQRTLLISALQLLAQSGAASAEGVICLAIEEPELFQHPIQAQTFAKVLRSLAEDAGKRIQVTYATHSPYFLEARHFDQVRRLTRSSDETPVVTVHLATVAGVKAKLNGVLTADTVDRQLDGIVANQLAVALFAHRAFLVEGTTESAVFYGIGDKTSLGSLEAAGIFIVPVGGKTSIPLAHAILASIGIPVYALFDADGGFEARAKDNGKAQTKIDEERGNHAKANRAVLKYFGRAEEDFPSAVVANEVAIFDDHLEAFLSANWAEWVTACNNLEAAAGISLAKNQLAYRTATLKAEGNVPEMLMQILAKAEGN